MSVNKLEQKLYEARKRLERSLLHHPDWKFATLRKEIADLEEAIARPLSEGDTSERIKQAYWQPGKRLFRNSVGALVDKVGRLVRFGLANDSKQMNELLKSADRIGWTTVLITPEMVWTHVAVFTSVEAKKEGWTPPKPGPEKIHGRITEYGHFAAQKRWADLVNREGGIAGFMSDPDEGFIDVY